MQLEFFKKLFKKIINPHEEEEAQTLEDLGDSLRNADLDYRFAQLFTHSGGFFNYCADESEALSILQQIINTEGISSFFAWDEDLKNFLNVIKVPYTEALETHNDAAFITCEYLIAYDGKIVLSHNNIKHYNSARLPSKIIIMATVSQIVTNLNDAMGKIKRAGSVKNLTSISGNQNRLDTSSPVNQKLFLLLLED